MLDEWNLLVSAVTACVAILALILNYKQMRLSNKQHLFDKRMENYLIARGLIQLYTRNYNVLNNEKDEPILAIDLEFRFLTNNRYLEGISCAIDNPLEGESHKELLIELEKLKEIATKIKFLFSGYEAILLGDFVFYYQELLFSMYQYKILIDRMQKFAREYGYTLEKAQEKMGEEKQRIKLEESFDNLKKVFNMLKEKDIEEKIKKQIKI